MKVKNHHESDERKTADQQHEFLEKAKKHRAIILGSRKAMSVVKRINECWDSKMHKADIQSI